MNKEPVCKQCGIPLRPIGEYVKTPKDRSKLCCPMCRTVYYPYEVGLVKRDVRNMANSSNEGEVPW